MQFNHGVTPNTKKIFLNYSLSESEFEKIYQKYIKLLRFQIRRHLDGNYRKFHPEEEEDILQEQLLALLQAAVYYKRQLYIESCLKVLKEYAKNEDCEAVEELNDLWKKRKGKRRFDDKHEAIMEKLMHKIVPVELHPDKKRSIEVNKQLDAYSKSSSWNRIKNIGIKISKEKTIRKGIVSIDDYEYLAYSEERYA